jgi:crotonobetainyl-CoA:carnitine CoA-transferase CaiB-like acyl-CoA transferase
MAGPCDGIRVLDFTTVISGPFPTQALGDLGADVVKVEPPLGDSSRYSGAPFREPGFSGFLAQFNRNKRSIALDLKQPEAQAAARRLAARSDVVVQNFRPGVAERLGLSYERLREDNPGLVYAVITGFGTDGPYAALPAYDHVIQGLTGLMPVQGGDGPPRLMLGGMADKATGTTTLVGVLAALLARERNGGVGQRIDVPMLDAFAAFALPEEMMSRSFPPLESDGPTSNDIFRTWETADGFVVGLVIQDAEFRGLCRAIGREDLLEVPGFRSTQGRFAHWDELAPQLEDGLRRLPTREFVARARELGAPFAPVQTVDEFIGDVQTVHNETVVPVEDPRFEAPTRYLRHPVRYEKTPASFRRHAPRLGEHTDEILSEAGFSGEEIEALRRSGAAR